MSSTPRNAMGSRQTVSSELTPREFHPSDGLPEPPSLPATVLSRSDCDWTGVPLFSLWVMAKSEAIRYFQSVMNEITPFHRSLLLNRSWRTAAHAYAHHNHKEEVFGEWVFGCQGAVPVFATQRKMGRRLFCLTPHSPWQRPFLDAISKFF